MTPPTDSDTQRIPVRYWIWLFGAAVSLLGDLTMTFAIGWSATQHGGGVAGLILLLAAAPRAVLLLVGGAIGDRFGAPRVLLAAVRRCSWPPRPSSRPRWPSANPSWLLVGPGPRGRDDRRVLPAVVTVDAAPAGAAGAGTPRAMASFQVTGVVFAVTGTAVGGVLVSWAGLTAAGGFDALTFGVMIVVLILLRKTIAPPGRMPTGMFRSIGDGDPGRLRPAAHPGAADHDDGRGRSADAAGRAAVPAARPRPRVGRRDRRSAGRQPEPRRGRDRPTHPDAGRVSSGRASSLPSDSWWRLSDCSACRSLDPLPLTIAAGVLSGIGVGTFTGHVLPLLMNSVEREFQSRLQSVVVLCQSLALVVMNPLLGSLADVDGIRHHRRLPGHLASAAAITGLRRTDPPGVLRRHRPQTRAPYRPARRPVGPARGAPLRRRRG